jgi:hypothetical protein
MLPKYHIITGFIASVIFLYLGFPPLAAITIFITSFLIDIDHYFIYIYKTKKFDLRDAYHFCVNLGRKWRKLSYKQKREHKMTIMIFHGIEFWLLLFLLSFLHPFFLWVLIGVLVHIVIDLQDLVNKELPLYSKLSQLYIWITNKKKKELK